MFPETEVNIDNLVQQTNQASTNTRLGRCFLFDFSEGEYVTKDGKLIEATEEQAIKQWVELLVRTVLNKYKVYENTGFGTTFDRIIGQKTLPQGFINSEVKRELEEKVIMHKRISGISDFSTIRTRYGLEIRFTVNKVDESMQEVSMVV